MRLLTIDDAARNKVKAVVEFASQPINYFLTGAGGRAGNVPGDDPRHVAELDAYRCVFTMTKSDQGLFRHLSISVPGRNYPSPFAVCEIARLFGFTGWDGASGIEAMVGKWLLDLHKDEHCVVVAQQLE